MSCWNKLLLVWALFGSMEVLCDELPLDRSGNLSSAIEEPSLKEDIDQDDDDDDCNVTYTDRVWLVEKDMKELVRHCIAHTLHEFSEIRLATLEHFIIQLKLYRLTGVLGHPLVVGVDPPHSIVFNRDMDALELKKILDKEDSERVLTSKIIPLSADSEIIREIRTSAGVSNFRELADTQKERDCNYIKTQWSAYLKEAGGRCTLDGLNAMYYRKKNYSFIKDRWEPFFRAAGVDFSLEGVAALYDRDMLKSRGIATLYDRDMNKAREVVIFYDRDKKEGTGAIILYDRDRNKGSIEKGIIIEYIREKKFAFINKETRVTKLPELYQYTEDGQNYIIWSIEIERQKNFIIYSEDKEGNIVAWTVDTNIPIDEIDFWDEPGEPFWD